MADDRFANHDYAAAAEGKVCQCNHCSFVRHQAELLDRESGYITPTEGAALTAEWFALHPDERMKPNASRLFEVEVESLGPNDRPKPGGLWDHWLWLSKQRFESGGLNQTLSEFTRDAEVRKAAKRK
jgi:hypothetical protein